MKVGEIYYTVEADTNSLVVGGKRADKALDDLDKKFGTVDKSARSTSNQMTKTAAAIRTMGTESTNSSAGMARLNGLLGTFLAMRTAAALSNMADEWTNLQNRLRLVTTSQEELNQATQHVVDIAMGTSQSLESVGQVYQRLAQNAQGLGLNLAQVAEITDTVSKAVAVSGASAASAQAALVQFGQALASGTLRGEELNSIMEQTPALASAIAKGLGISVGALRELGQEGKITSAALIDALQKAAGSVNEQFATRVKTVQSAFVDLGTAMTKFVGEASTATSASATLAEGITLVAQNLDVVANIIGTVAGGALAFYIAKMTAAAVTSATATIAARAQAVAELQLAEANAAAATAASVNATRMAQLTGSHAAAATAATAQTAALTRLAAAQAAVAGVGRILLGLLGGPVGIIGLVATAATGMYLFSGNSEKATASLVDMTQPLDNVIKKFKELSASQRELTLASVQKDVVKGVQDLDAAYAQLAKGSLADGTKAVAAFRATSQQQIASLVEGAKTGKISFATMDAEIVNLVKSYAAANGRSAEWTNEQIRLTTEVSTAAVRLQAAQQQSKALADANNNLAGASRNAAAAQTQLNMTLSGADTDAGKYLKSLQDRVGALQDGNSAVKGAERWIAANTAATEADKIAIMSAAQAADYLTKQQAAVKSGLQSSASAAKENANAINKLKEELREAGLAGDQLAVIRARNQLNAFAKPAEIKQVEDLARAIYAANEALDVKGKIAENEKQVGQLSAALGLAALHGRELAMQQAQLSLNEYATPEQVAQVRAIASATYDLAKAEELRKKIEGDDQGQAAKTAKNYIRGTVDPLKGGEFDQQVARYEAERKLEEQRYIDQQERMKEAMNANIEIQGGYFMLEEQMAKEHADRMGQIETAKTMLMLKAGESGFGAMADAMKSAFGEQSALYKAAFVAQKAFAIAQSIVAIQQGIALAAANPWPLNIGAMASVAAATAGLISNIAGVTMGAGRQYGGNVAPGSMHRINENGAPEIFNAANGQQFALPTTRGKIVSNKDATESGGAGGLNISFNLIEDQSKAGTVAQRTEGNTVNIDAFVSDIRGGGKAARAIEGTYGLSRKGS